jgi:hypothetical protein
LKLLERLLQAIGGITAKQRENQLVVKWREEVIEVI